MFDNLWWNCFSCGLDLSGFRNFMVWVVVSSFYIMNVVVIVLMFNDLWDRVVLGILGELF